MKRIEELEIEIKLTRELLELQRQLNLTRQYIPLVQPIVIQPYYPNYPTYPPVTMPYIDDTHIKVLLL